MRWIGCIILFFSPLAAAQPPDALAAYKEGHYVKAAGLAEAYPEADNLAFAARAVLAGALSMPVAAPDPQALSQAEDYARRALTLDPGHQEARLQLAVTLSFQARAMRRAEALRSGFGQTAKALVSTILLDDSENLYAHAFLATWHIEVLRRGGRFGARLLGANLKDAYLHYQTAVCIDPDDAAVHWQWARALAARNVRRHRKDIEAALEAALAANADDALERLMQIRAHRLQEALVHLSDREAQALAASLL